MPRLSSTVTLLLLALVPTTSAFNLFAPPSQKSSKANTLERRPTTKRPPSRQENSQPLSTRSPLPPLPPNKKSNNDLQFNLPEVPDLPDAINPLTSNAWNDMTSAALGFAAKFAPKSVTEHNERAARIIVSKFPPDSIQVDLSDVPIVGRALSGTFAKVKAVSQPSVVISSPQDQFGALRQASDEGSLNFGLSGILQSNVDVKFEPNRPGVAPIEIKSPLIPKWPFAKRKSDWNKVQNLGNGDTYYFNSRTGEIQYEEP
eukprot:scaffold3240_cov187-Amphora_coffeaeformis.AAC.16